MGVLAHVDAGKTTLSEALLYCAGVLRTPGRVDHGDAYLDNFTLERERGITIFAKQAALWTDGVQITLLDTPGHVDFSPETERTLDVLDCAVLVISAPEGVQSHTETLWRLLRMRGIPTFVFINKMDLPCPDRAELVEELANKLGGVFFDAEHPDWETVAMGGETLLERIMEAGELTDEELSQAVDSCQVFPCWFGAALKLSGVGEFLKGLARLAPGCPERREFGARVFKITHNERGAKEAHLKVTGGVLRPRDILRGDGWEYKVTQLRRYSGGRTSTVQEALPGDLVAISGLEAAYPGLGLGAEPPGKRPALEPVLRYSLTFPEGTDIHTALAHLRELQQEEPELDVTYDDRTKDLAVRLMGQVQLEILKEILLERWGLDAAFGPGRILYRETIAAPVEGVGHYEPLRHYAEVHLLLEPGEPGSGIQAATACPEDELEGSWQRLILTHLLEKQHLGVLTGSPITDIKFTLTAGRAHVKHTEGGDFREATYRAVRQGLMSASSVLLEPWYDFRLEVPAENLGRALGDLTRMSAEMQPPEPLENGPGATVRITGSAPVSKLGGYATELAAYSRGKGRLSCDPSGFRPCPDTDQVVSEVGYDPEADVENSPDSIFCGHGAGMLVKWYDVPRYMHLESPMERERREQLREQAERYVRQVTTDKELQAIFERTYGPIRREKRETQPPRRVSQPERTRAVRPKTDGQEFVLVDGYNIIFSWPDLKALASESLEAARDRLIETLRNYQGFRQCAVILVFDAYKVRGGQRSIERVGDFSIVYTKEAETADMYIERTTYDLAKKHYVRVATSDGLEQVIILGNGALRVPARAFEAEVRETERSVQELLAKLRWTN